MRIEDYQKWLSSQFLDEQETEEPQAAEADTTAQPEVPVEPVQWAPAPAAAPAPAWRPPTPPPAAVVPAEALDTTLPGPAAYIGRPPTHAPRAVVPQADLARAEAPSFLAPSAPPAPPRVDTEPVYTQPPRVIDTSEEVAPPMDRYFRLRRSASVPEQLPLEGVAPDRPAEPLAEAQLLTAVPGAEAEPEPEPEPAPESPVSGPDAVAPVPAERPVWVEPDVPADRFPEAAAEPRSEPDVGPPAEEPAARAEPAPAPKAEAPIRRARHARNVRPTEVVREMDAKTLWNLVPRHIQTLVAMDSDEVTQNSYKRSFRESRIDLVQRLLDPTLSLEETARLLNVCPTTVRRYTNRGLLTHQRTSGDQRRFKLSDVLAFLEAQQRARD